MTVRQVVIAIALLVGGCLDPSPEDPRQLDQDAEVVLSDQGSDTGLADDCPARPTSGTTSRDRCVYSFVYRQSAGQTPSSVALAGSFECPEWQGAYPLSGPNDAGEWYLDLQLRPGRYEYKFIVDGEWTEDPESSDRVPDGLGGQNSVVTHSCPFSPACVLNSDCLEPSLPVCRNYACSP